MEIDFTPGKNTLNKTADYIQTQRQHRAQFGQPSFGGKFLSVTSGHEPFKIKRKFVKIVPKLSERSKVIGKGTGYNEKLEKRKQGKFLLGPSNGGNVLN